MGNKKSDNFLEGLALFLSGGLGALSTQKKKKVLDPMYTPKTNKGAENGQRKHF